MLKKAGLKWIVFEAAENAALVLSVWAFYLLMKELKFTNKTEHSVSRGEC